MMRQLIEVFPLSIYAAISIFIFMFIFLFVVFRLYRWETKEGLSAKAQIVFDDLESPNSGRKNR